MATCSPQTLMDDAACFACLPNGTLQVIQTRLLCQILQALDPDMTCDPNTLMANAACLACLPPGMLQVIQTQLLCDISSAISGGGGIGSGCVPSTNGDPEGVLVSNCTPAIAVDPNTSAIYLFTGVAGTNIGWALKV